MAYIDLTPSSLTVSGITNGWTNVYNIISEDNQYAAAASSDTSILFVDFYTANHGNSLVPVDSVITGLQIFYTARVSGGSGAYLKFNYCIDNTRTQVATAIMSPLLTNTEVGSSVGSSSNTFGLPLQWVDLNTLTNGRPAGNPWFSVAVQSASSTPVPIWIDSLYLRVHYTTYNYLVGSRTKFHLNRPDLGLDVIMKSGVADSGSYITRKDNSIDSDNQVNSSDVNILGDALYNIESSILASSGNVYAIDLKKTYVFAITVSAFCNSAVSANVVVYGKIRNDDKIWTNAVNIAGYQKSVAPNVSGSILCYWTSAIGWTEDGAGNTHPLFVSAQGARFAKAKNGIDFAIGLTALASSIGTTENYDSYGSNYQGYVGAHFVTAPSSGKVYFKILALGREV